MTIIEKIKTNNILQLTNDEYDLILSNSLLIKNLIEAIKNGADFDLEEMPIDLQNKIVELEDFELLTIIIKKIEEQSPEQFLEILCEYDTTEKSTLTQVIINQTQIKLSEIKQRLINKETYRIKNEYIIPLIIKNNLTYYIDFIHTPITKELEDFIIKNIESEEIECLNATTPAITDKCTNTHRIYLIYNFITKYTEEQYQELENEFISDKIPVAMIYYIKDQEAKQRLHKNPKILFKIVLDNPYSIDSYIECLEEIKNSPLAIEYLSNYIKEQQNATQALHILGQHILQIGLAICKYTNIIIESKSSSNDEKTKLFNYLYINHLPELLKATEYFCTEHIQEIQDLYGISYYLKNYPKLLPIVAKHLSGESVLKLLSQPYLESFVLDEIKDELNNNYYPLTEIPENVFFRNMRFDYCPPSLLMNMLKVIKKEDLIPSNIDITYFTKTPELLNAFFEKLKDFKSNSYNSFLYKIRDSFTEQSLSIIQDEKNPLNITFAVLHNITTIHTRSPIFIEKMFEAANEIPSEELPFLKLILITENKNYKDTKDLFIKIVKSDKVKKDQKFLDFIVRTIDDLVNQTNKDFYNDMALILKDCLEDYYELPLEVAFKFDPTFALEHSVNHLTDEVLAGNVSYFETKNSLNNTYLSQVIDRLIEEIDQGRKINIDIILWAIINNKKLTNQYSYVKSEEYTQALKEYRDKEEKLIGSLKKDNIILNQNNYKQYLSTYINNPEISNFILNRWIPNLTLETINKNDTLITKIFENEKYHEKLIEQIKEKLKENPKFIFDNKLLKYFGISEVLDNYLISLCNNNFEKSVYGMSTELILSTNKHIINHITKIISSETFQTDTTSLEKLYQNPIYLETLIQKYNQGIKNVIHENLINEKILEIPKAKEFIIRALKEGTIIPTFNYYNINNAKWKYDILSSIKDFDALLPQIITSIVHSNKTDYIPDDSFEFINEKINKVYNIPKEKLDIIISYAGKDYLLLMEKEEFHELLKYSSKEIDKFFNIFKIRPLDKNTILAINDSLRQNIFSYRNSKVIEIYTNIIAKLQSGCKEEELNTYITTLAQFIPNKYEEYIIGLINETKKETKRENHLELLEKYQEFLEIYRNNKNDKEQFIRELFKKILENQSIYGPFLNKITNNYILQKRNEDRKTYDIFQDTNIKYKYESKSLYEAIFNFLIKNNYNKLLNYLDRQSEKYNDYVNTIYYLSNPEKYLMTVHPSKEALKQIHKNIRPLKEYFLQIFSQLETTKGNTYATNELMSNFGYILEIPEVEKNIKKIPIMPERKFSVAEIFKNYKVSHIIENVCKDEKVYQALLQLLEKYSIHEWQDIFNKAAKDLSIEEGTEEIHNFIIAFNQIYAKEEKLFYKRKNELIKETITKLRYKNCSEEEIKKVIREIEEEDFQINISPYKILKYCILYSSISNHYKLILGAEDFELIKRNDGPNTAHATAEERLNNTIQLQIKMMQFNEITIPSFNHKYKIDEEKSLRVIIGNRADSRNLTHGERTGACMRSKGHADSLFNFCNTDPRGFHFTFVDPKTDEYVSRVSGFRNGNTIFLNQLRCSVSSKYTDEDVINACISAAKEIIDRSKDSEMPIENIVCSPCYALGGYKTTEITPSYDIGLGVYHGYKDVTNNAVILATSSEEEFAPVKLDATNQPIYSPVRLTPKHYKKEKINTSVLISMNRISTIKQCIEHPNPEYWKMLDYDYELFEEDKFQYVIIGQDWYIAIDNNLNITYDIIHSPEAEKELSAAMEEIESHKNTKTGGLGYGL